jgi:Flp pilus assembly protein TadB
MRLSGLVELQPSLMDDFELVPSSNLQPMVRHGSSLERYLRFADIGIAPSVCVVILLLLLVATVGIGLVAFPIFLLPLFVGLVAVTLYVFLEKRIEEKAFQFSSEYPAVLMATASSVRAGMSPYDALERSIRLLPKTSLVRTQIEQMLLALHKGTSRTDAIEYFGHGVRLPDVQLFQEAFHLVLDHGGRFAPTLERLADVCRDRSTLIRSANVTTATMRMTANILIAVTPFILALVSMRTENFWELFFNDPVASPLAMSGLLVIGLSYVALLKMSSFRP